MTEPDFPPPPAPVQVRRRFSPLLAIFLMLAVVGAVAAAIGVVKVLGYGMVTVPGGSMAATIPPGTTVVYSWGEGREIHRGDLVVFQADALPGVPGGRLLKRVIAVGGDRVFCCDPANRIEVNGKSVTEPYLDPKVSPPRARCRSRRRFRKVRSSSRATRATTRVTPGFTWTRRATVPSRCPR